jgi:hypothetical protein
VLKGNALLLAASIAAAPPALPLAVSALVKGPQSHVTLTNTAHQPVTAWALATLIPQDNGRVRREIETVDGYMSEVTHGLPGSSERLERLLPGQARQIALDPLPDTATVEVVAVVLADGTAIGEADVIRTIFARRVAERDALQAVVSAFSDVLGSAQGEAALDALRERLSAIAARAESTPTRAALDAVDTYRTRGGAPEAIDQSLRAYADFVGRQHALAVKHATSRPSVP